MSHSEAGELGREIAALRRRVEELENGQRARQLDDSSFRGTLRMRDDDTGAVRGAIGRQADGKYALTYANGEAPPAPSAATLLRAEHALVVHYDGTMADGEDPPTDVERIDIHESETAGFTADGSTIKSSLPPAEGARLLVLDNQEHYIKLVAVNSSGVASEPSEEVSATPLLISDLDVDALSGKTITGATLRTGESGERVVITPSGPAGGPSVLFYPGVADSAPGYSISGVSSGDLTYVTTRSPYVGSGYQGSLVVRGGPAVLDTGVKLNDGRFINGIDFGYATAATVDGNAYVSVEHNLAVTPVAAFALGNDGSPVQYLKWVPASSDAVQITFRVRHVSDGSLTPDNPIDFSWLALA